MKNKRHYAMIVLVPYHVAPDDTVPAFVHTMSNVVEVTFWITHDCEPPLGARYAARLLLYAHTCPLLYHEYRHEFPDPSYPPSLLRAVSELRTNDTEIFFGILPSPCVYVTVPEATLSSRLIAMFLVSNK